MLQTALQAWPSWFHPWMASSALIASIALLVLSVALGPFLIARIPADYFVREPDSRKRTRLRHVAQNMLGGLLVIAGIAMLVLPGQGVLTMLVGLSLLNYPGKRKLELKLVRHPAVNKTISSIRRRAGKATLELGEEHDHDPAAAKPITSAASRR